MTVKVSVSRNNILLINEDLSRLIVPGQSLEFFIGRSKECHFTLDDQTISRNQCSLIYDGKDWHIANVSDLGYVLLNNSFLAGKVKLKDYDTLLIGEYTITFDNVLNYHAKDIIENFNETEDETTTTEETKTSTVAQTDAISIPDDLPEDDLPSLDSTETSTSTENTATEAPPIGDEFSELDSSFNDNDLLGDNQAQDGAFGEEYATEEGAEAYSEDEYASDEYGDYDGALTDYEDVGEGTRILGGFAKFSLELFGEYAPYDTYNIQDPEVFIGRDPEKCKIVLQDPEVSAVHAVIKKNNITCILEDLKSANGTILNGKRVNSVEITNGDEFIIGGTTFTVRVGNEFIDSQKGMLMPVDDNQEIEVEEVVEVGEDEFDGDEFGENVAASTSKGLFTKDALKDPVKRKKIIYILVGLMVLWMLLDDGETAKTTDKKADPKANAKVEENKTKPGELPLTPEQAEQLESLYQLGQAYIAEGKYPEAINEFDKLFVIRKEYKQAVQLYQIAKEKLAQIEKAELERRAEEERALKKKKVAELLTKAEEAVKERNVTLAEGMFVKIRELDPDNYDVTNLELELNAYKKEKAEREVAEAQKIAERKRMVDSLAPGKALYLKEEWYKAGIELEKFLEQKNIDEDLLKEGTDMLKDAKSKLEEIVGPLLGKARSLKEGEDLKGAYGVYNEVLKFDPTSVEALNEMDDIKFTLTSRSKKIFREAIVAESLGLYEKAKEKYQEILQITPEDNEYFKKASERLKDL